MYALFEDDGDLKAGTIQAETDATAQIELASGRRLKVKLAAVLLKFPAPEPEALIAAAQAQSGEIDLGLLWDTLPDTDLTFSEIAKEYFGASATVTQQTGALMQLMAHPMYFRKRGKGLFKRAPEIELKAALASVERKKQEALLIEAQAQDLASGQLPESFGTPPNVTIDRLLYAPDKNAHTTKTLARACELAQTSAVKLLQASGALRSTHDYHFRRFLFHTFPKGIAFPEIAVNQTATAPSLPTAQVRAFSIDDAETTEIDDAFSVSLDGQGRTVIGIHIAAPALGVVPDSPADLVARERLSTVYMPGNKITMLPPAFVEQFTLAQGRTVPALSLYATVDADYNVLSTDTRVDAVPIVANLRLQHLDDSIVDPLAPTRAPWQDDMIALHAFAKARFATRGKNEVNRVDYNFYVDCENDDYERARVRIEARARGSAIDLIVSELMIFANATWGEALAAKGIAGMFRVQGAGKTKMSVHPGAHEGLGVKTYLWSTSPLRRYSDLINQRQLLALAQNQTPPYTKQNATLLAAVADFDVTYNQYGDFQQQMENYWCCRWLLQESVTELTGTVVRENVVRFDRLPIVRRIEDLPFSAPGAGVTIRVHSVDLLAASFSASASVTQ